MTRAIQLIRTDDTVPGTVRFYDRRVTNAQAAFIAEVNVTTIPDKDGNEWGESPAGHPLIRAAVHGVTQNILDASNKLEGDARCAYIREMCVRVQSGGWATTPTDPDAARDKAIKGLLGCTNPATGAKFTQAEAEALLG